MNKNTPAVKGVRTSFQVVVAFLVGLVLVVWAVPGVPEAVIQYFKEYGLQTVLGFSGLSGLLSYFQNLAEDRRV